MKQPIEQGIEPVAIIAYQQAAQVKGICVYIKNANSKLDKSLIHIPCIAHVTNLIYVEILAMDEFKPFLDEIDELISFCRIEEIAMQLGRYCPTLVKTRWFYLSEVLNFFELLEEEINILRIGYEFDPISPQIIEFGKILKPLMNFTYFAERRDSKLSEILPKMKETFDLIKNVHDELQCEESLVVHKFVLATFLARMHNLP